VFECRRLGKRAAGELLRPRRRAYETVREHWLRELQDLTQLRHPHLIHVFDAFESRDAVYLILERCSFSLEDLLHWGMSQRKPGSNRLPEACSRASTSFTRLSSSPDYSSRQHLYASRGWREARAESGDFLQAGRPGDQPLQPDHRVLGTMLKPSMLPPEFLNPGEFGKPGRGVDIYQAGLIFLSLLEGCTPGFTQDEILGGDPRKWPKVLFHPSLRRSRKPCVLTPRIARARRASSGRTSTIAGSNRALLLRQWVSGSAQMPAVSRQNCPPPS